MQLDTSMAKARNRVFMESKHHKVCMIVVGSRATRGFSTYESTHWCTPGMGVNLWGASPLYVESSHCPLAAIPKY
jgi:hypothetical protein